MIVSRCWGSDVDGGAGATDGTGEVGIHQGRYSMRFLFWLKKWFCRSSRITIPVGGLNEVVTQKDKPSPSSHFSLMELYNLKRRQYRPQDGYFWTLIQNTNSMEPLVDDNSVVVCENFRHSKGKKWLEEWPLRVGDVCIYVGDPAVWGKDVMILHQISKVYIDKEGFRFYKFKGVNNWSSDYGWVPEKAIIYRAFEFCSAKQKREGD